MYVWEWVYSIIIIDLNWRKKKFFFGQSNCSHFKIYSVSHHTLYSFDFCECTKKMVLIGSENVNFVWFGIEKSIAAWRWWLWKICKTNLLTLYTWSVNRVAKLPLIRKLLLFFRLCKVLNWLDCVFMQRNHAIQIQIQIQISKKYTYTFSIFDIYKSNDRFHNNAIVCQCVCVKEKRKGSAKQTAIQIENTNVHHFCGKCCCCCEQNDIHQ